MKTKVINSTESTDISRESNYFNSTNTIVFSTTLAISMATMTMPDPDPNFYNSSNDFNSSELLMKNLDSDSQINTETNSKPTELDLLNRYSKISDSEWFKSTYHGKSIGQIVGIEA
ncbi:MAG: hypothetical protein JJU13_08320 [Balneolaceae bacterium]|nr:hypothetical protein [Balneolaceae bacterium]